MSKLQLKNKVIIITGASSGIGEELAYKLSSKGAKLSLAARNEEKLKAVAEKCQALNAEVIYSITDVSREEQCRNLIERTIEKFESIDVLINNAGFAFACSFENICDMNNFRKVMDVNLMGSVYCTYYALPYIKKNKGQIAAIASVAGKVASPGQSAYNASKFAMNGFFDAIRMELASGGVGVTVIYPGFVITKFAENVVKENGEARGEGGSKFYNPKLMMSASTCAKIIVKAIEHKRRDVILTPFGPNALFSTLFGRVVPFFNTIFPRLVDRIVIRYRDSFKA